MAFVDQGKFEAMRTLSSQIALRCDKDQFPVKMKVQYLNLLQDIVVVDIVVLARQESLVAEISF